MSSLSHYPSEIPKAEITIVLNGIRGQDDGQDLSGRLEAGWWVWGYGMSFVPSGSAGESGPVFASAPPSAKPESELASHLEAVMEKSENEGFSADALAALPWSTILPLLLTLLQKWASK